MSILDFIRNLIAPTPADITSPERKRQIEAQQREAQARVRMLRIETEVLTAQKIDQWKRESS